MLQAWPPPWDAVPPRYTVLEHDGWLTWNEERSRLQPLRLSYGSSEPTAAKLETVVYVNKAGAVRMPRRNPYIPLSFQPSASTRSDRIGKQWLALAQEFAEDIRHRGLIGSLALSPGYLDARPFQWLGFDATLRYTYVERLPWSVTDASGSVRNKIRKARAAGYTVTPSTDWQALHECLVATEDAKQFKHGTSPRELERLHTLLGPERFTAFATHRPDVGVVGASLRLHDVDGAVVDWSAGTRREVLSDGVVQYAYANAMTHAVASGATHFDFAGANITAVAAAKAAWGFRLVPYLVISSPGVRTAARTVLRGLRLGRSRARP